MTSGLPVEVDVGAGTPQQFGQDDIANGGMGCTDDAGPVAPEVGLRPLVPTGLVALALSSEPAVGIPAWLAGRIEAMAIVSLGLFPATQL